MSNTDGLIYRFIVKYLEQHGYPPTRREIMRGVGIGSTNTVAHNLHKLEKAGRIEIVPEISRGIRLVPVENEESE